MRDREYLVAIFARHGILCAETLRFHDEIRDPLTIGLSKVQPANRRRISTFERAIDALSAKAVASSELVDKHTEALKAIIARKKKAGRDLVRAEDETKASAGEDDDEIDLLESIRRSLRQAKITATPRRPTAQGSKMVHSPKNPGVAGDEIGYISPEEGL
jgi:non-homologous end joining protein Ku